MVICGADDMTKVVGVKLYDGRIYEFDASDTEFKQGDRVLVDTEKGQFLGTVAVEAKEKDTQSLLKTLRPILRKATDSDLQQDEKNVELQQEALDFCLQRIRARGLSMKLVQVEFLFDRSKAIFYFTSEKRVDFRELVKDLASKYHTRIEMRQIGVRDEAKMVGGTGSCGRELCCCRFLNTFDLVSVRMAKEQNLALNPEKISGVCGRLMCCLAFEHEIYSQLRKDLPKLGKRIKTKFGQGKVIRQNILAQTVTLQLENGVEMTLNVSDL
jgi:cell fate regulator YaaT (PSP1 superfamily)